MFDSCVYCGADLFPAGAGPAKDPGICCECGSPLFASRGETDWSQELDPVGQGHTEVHVAGSGDLSYRYYDDNHNNDA